MRLSTKYAACAISCVLIVWSNFVYAQSDYQEVPESGFPILFDENSVPSELGNRMSSALAKRLKKRRDNDTIFVHFQRHTDADGYSRMVLIVLDPGFHYEYNTEIDSQLRTSSHFKKGKGKIINSGSFSSSLGSVRYALYTLDSSRCLRFGRVFGQSGGDNFGIGDKQFIGEHCRPQTESFDQNILKALSPAWSFTAD